MNTKGAVIATAVAGLFASVTPLTASAKDTAKVHCGGVNACSGKGGCKSADNACKGKNGCKGKGWVAMSEDDCKKKGGTVTPAATTDKK